MNFLKPGGKFWVPNGEVNISTPAPFRNFRKKPQKTWTRLKLVRGRMQRERTNGLDT